MSWTERFIVGSVLIGALTAIGLSLAPGALGWVAIGLSAGVWGVAIAASWGRYLDIRSNHPTEAK